MGFLDRLFGQRNSDRQVPPVPQNPYGYASAPASLTPPVGATGVQPPRSQDELAIERYRYLLRAAPPETIEQVHAEAFGKLSPAQRQQVLAELTASLPPYERPQSNDPRSLARAATRAEYRQPGFMERTLGRPGTSFGAPMGGSLMGGVVGFVVGSALVSSIIAPTYAYDAGYQDGVAADVGAGTDAGGFADPGAGWGGDAGFGDFGGGDFGF